MEKMRQNEAAAASKPVPRKIIEISDSDDDSKTAAAAIERAPLGKDSTSGPKIAGTAEQTAKQIQRAKVEELAARARLRRGRVVDSESEGDSSSRADEVDSDQDSESLIASESGTDSGSESKTDSEDNSGSDSDYVSVKSKRSSAPGSTLNATSSIAPASAVKQSTPVAKNSDDAGLPDFSKLSIRKPSVTLEEKQQRNVSAPVALNGSLAANKADDLKDLSQSNLGVLNKSIPSVLRDVNPMRTVSAPLDLIKLAQSEPKPRTIELLEDEPKFTPDDLKYVPPKQAEEALKNLFEGAMEEPDDGIDVTDNEIAGTKIKLFPHQVRGVKWMLSREAGGNNERGGILADDMGLGKTIQTLAVIASHKPTKSLRKEWGKTTLLVAPKGLVPQWVKEAKKWCKGSIRVIAHTEANRTRDPEDFDSYDLVVTSYPILTSENSEDRGRHTALMDNDWYRVVLDEAHNIKNPSSKSSLACCALSCHFRWVLTGTPIQNSADDLFALLRFLEFKPLNVAQAFKERISLPFKAGRVGMVMKRLQVILRKIMLRRTKDMLNSDGSQLIPLPKKTLHLITCIFDADEAAFYDALALKTENILNKYAGRDVKMSYTNMLTLLLRLRQACNHPLLVTRKLSELPKEDNLGLPEKSPDLKSTDDDELAKLMGGASLLDEPEINTKEMVDHYNEAKSARSSSSSSTGGIPPSTKIRKILDLLKEIELREDSDGKRGKQKTIIFSQFTGMLDTIEQCLTGYKYARYDGSMTTERRIKNLDDIEHNDDCKIILISFKAGGTGLNLVWTHLLVNGKVLINLQQTCCNNVILVDMWWNPALEDQAFDRAHRFGQKKEVEIYKLYVANTVEDKILELQSKKRLLASAALSGEKLSAKSQVGMAELMKLFGRPNVIEDAREIAAEE